jgi:hypothetical protein
MLNVVVLNVAAPLQDCLAKKILREIASNSDKKRFMKHLTLFLREGVP